MPLSLDFKTPFPWRKKGRVELPAIPGFTHAGQPCIVHVDGDKFVLCFNARNGEQKSHTFLAFASVSDGDVRLISEPKMALAPGQPAGFDCDGAMGCCFVKHDGLVYLYYIGWQNFRDGLFGCDTGRAILDVDALTLRREYLGPVFGRDKNNPLFAAATAFHVEGDRWRAWYNSGVRWDRLPDGSWKHYYGLHHAHSSNGVDWISDPGQCLPFQDEHEYAFGRPSVFVKGGLFLMWFAHRATKAIDTYRIGFAWSEDGLNWNRNDALSGVDVSAEGWDSEMICYPCVFEHEGRMYMLYNGNGYGRSGFGYAVLD